MNIQRSKMKWLGVGLISAVVLGSGVATAQSNGVISACKDDRTGSVVLVPNQRNTSTACPAGSVAVSWNVQGPVGPAGQTGPRGATGAQGPQGPIGPSNAYTKVAGGGLPELPGASSPPADLIWLDLPPGSYLLSVNGYFTQDESNLGFGDKRVRCTFDGDSFNFFMSVNSSPQGMPHTVSWSKASLLQYGGRPTLACHANGGLYGNTEVRPRYLRINAIRVGSIDIQ